MKRSATLNDVAARAGVSTATVARVIHGRGYVARETRERVLEAVDAVEYRVNSLAQGLKKQRTGAVGQILQSTFPNYLLCASGARRGAVGYPKGV